MQLKNAVFIYLGTLALTLSPTLPQPQKASCVVSPSYIYFTRTTYLVDLTTLPHF